MDQNPQYLMSMKNQYLHDFYFRAPAQNMFNKSWEEQAFADDVAFIWPPRSYSCSFCKRKFRSAQALGGHMNVHRRDRARLRLSQTSQIEDTSSANFNLNPNPNFGMNFLTLSNSPCNVSDSKDAERKEDCRSMGYDESNLSIGLNLMLSRTRPCGFECNEGVSPKKIKTTVLSTMPFFLKPCSNESHVQGLDLELRLGDAPKLK